MFLNATMLAGIAGAALPLLVHLLSRARVRTVDWGAMMFLEEGRGSNDQAARLKQWTLLLLRMGIVALLAVALARPIAAGGWAGPAGPLTSVIVVDVSGSMNQPAGGGGGIGRTRMDVAREVVLKLLAGMQKGDRAALVLAGSTATDERSGAPNLPSADLQAVAARVAELKPSAGSADLAASLNEAVGLIDRHGGANARLYLVCDTQAASWAGVTEPFQKTWPARTTRAGRRTPFEVIQVGETGPTDNIAIDSVSLPISPAIAGLPAEVEVRVRQFGGKSPAAVPLVVRSSKGEVFNGTVQVPPDDARALTFPVRFDAPGQQTLSAEITTGTLRADDRAAFLLDVVPPIRVLVVSGDERGEGGDADRFRNESDFFRTALAPFAATKRPGVDPARVTVVSAERWSDTMTAEADVLVLANVAELTPQQVRSVESFVYAGGGLLVAPGGTSRPDSYTRALFRDGAGPLPASLGTSASDQPTALLGLDLNHPVFRFLRGRPDPIPSAVVTRHFAAAPRQGAAVLATYVTGQPWLIESSYGRGRVLLMTTTLDADWNTLPLTSFYLPFAQSVVRHLASAALPQRDLPPGGEIRARFRETPEGVRATLTSPDGRTSVLQAAGYEGNYEVATSDTRLPGVYTLRTTVNGRERVERYSVRPPSTESDLRPLEAAEWAEFQKGLGFRRGRPGAGRDVLSTATLGRDGRELWLPVLLGVFLLGAAELTLTRLWSEAR